MRVTIALIVSAFILQGQEKQNILLWKISGNGLEESSYLYGTIHLLCVNDLALSNKLKTALDKSGQLVLELDFDDPYMMKTLQKNMVFRDGTTAKDYLRMVISNRNNVGQAFTYPPLRPIPTNCLIL